MLAFANLVFSSTTLRKLRALLREHRLDQIANTLLFGYHTLRGFPDPRLPYCPPWLVLDITVRCNFHCSHCPHGNPASPHKLHFHDMSLDTYVRILDRFPRAIVVGLGGGEPLLNPHALDMIAIAGERRMKVHVSTNGSTLSESISSYLAAPIELLNISFYGVDGESFAQCTGADADIFQDILQAVAELSKRRDPGGYPRILRTSFICTKRSMSSAFDFIRLSEELEVDAAKLRNLYPLGIQGYDESQCLFEDDPEVQEFMAMLRSRTYRIPVFPPRLYQRSYSPRRCIAPYQQLNIGGDESIGPCCEVGPDKRWGSLLDPDVWNGPTLTEMRRSLRDELRPLPPGCLACEQMIPERTSL